MSTVQEMGKDKFPRYSEIPWGKIREITVSTDGGSYGFEFEIAGKKQMMTITIADGQTSFMLSKPDGSPIINATQKGRDVRVIDFSKKIRLKGAKLARKHN